MPTAELVNGKRYILSGPESRIFNAGKAEEVDDELASKLARLTTWDGRNNLVRRFRVRGLPVLPPPDEPTEQRAPDPNADLIVATADDIAKAGGAQTEGPLPGSGDMDLTDLRRGQSGV